MIRIDGYLLDDPTTDLASMTLEELFPRTAVGDSLHLLRLDEPAPEALLDLGSGGVDGSLVGASWTRDVPGPYRARGGIAQTAPAGFDAVIVAPTSIPAAGFTMAVTVLSRTRTAPAGYRSIMSANTFTADPALNYVSIWNQNAASSSVYITMGKGAFAEGSSAYVIPDWARAFRLLLQYVASTRRATLYVNGVQRIDYPHGGGVAISDCNRVSILGGEADGPISGSVYGGNSYLLASDAQVWTRLLSAQEIAEDWSLIAGSLI